MIRRRVAPGSRALVEDAVGMATDLGAPAVEAEHLLLAVAGGPRCPARQVLVDAGLGYDQARAALEREFARSLAVAGVRLGDFALPAPSPAARRPRWGASAKLALSRAAAAGRGSRARSLSPEHVLLGVLRARAGTVPRALAGAGVDPVALAERVRAAAAR